ncbi:hypothetical protein HRbin02_01597 [Candidatus Calditenuaceae archaeon HR02]|nr:hypothetical protein HRbin02_01597 [Candidatus Calditenuaceae archaeon HR02]
MISYGAGALVTVLATAGALLLLVGAGVIPIQPLTAAGIILSALGIYTVTYGAASREPLYYFLWGGIALVIGTGISTPSTVNPLIAAGIALIFIAGIGAYAIAKKSRRAT